MTELPEKPLTVARAAELLDVDEDTVYRLIHDGFIPAFKIGRQWRIPRKPFIKMLDSGFTPENSSPI